MSCSSNFSRVALEPLAGQPGKFMTVTRGVWSRASRGLTFQEIREEAAETGEPARKRCCGVEQRIGWGCGPRKKDHWLGVWSSPASLHLVEESEKRLMRCRRCTSEEDKHNLAARKKCPGRRCGRGRTRSHQEQREVVLVTKLLQGTNNKARKAVRVALIIADRNHCAQQERAFLILCLLLSFSL